MQSIVYRLTKKASEAPMDDPAVSKVLQIVGIWGSATNSQIADYLKDVEQDSSFNTLSRTICLRTDSIIERAVASGYLEVCTQSRGKNRRRVAPLMSKL